MKFIVSRKKWRTGGFGAHQTGEGETRLLNAQGFQCCLGQVAQQCGVQRPAMLGAGTPYNLTEYQQQKLPKWLRQIKSRDENSSGAKQAMGINDGNFTLSEKESKLRALFRKHGDQIVFKP